MAFGSKGGIKVTEKGTELQLMSLKGKDYLPVAQRLVWFREKYPEGSIQTDLHREGETAVAKATIAVPINNNYVVLATAHKIETEKSFPDGHAEKAETGAIGRALAMAGFGTQFETEFDEGERSVDAPVEAKKSRPVTTARPTITKGKGSDVASSHGATAPEAVKEGGSQKVVGANAELRVVEAGASQPSGPEEDEAAYARKCIAAEADVIVNVKKTKSAAELKQILKERYGVESKNALSAEQASEFLQYLKSLSA